MQGPKCRVARNVDFFSDEAFVLPERRAVPVAEQDLAVLGAVQTQPLAQRAYNLPLLYVRLSSMII